MSAGCVFHGDQWCSCPALTGEIDLRTRYFCPRCEQILTEPIHSSNLVPDGVACGPAHVMRGSHERAAGERIMCCNDERCGVPEHFHKHGVRYHRIVAGERSEMEPMDDADAIEQGIEIGMADVETVAPAKEEVMPTESERSRSQLSDADGLSVAPALGPEHRAGGGDYPVSVSDNLHRGPGFASEPDEIEAATRRAHDDICGLVTMHWPDEPKAHELNGCDWKHRSIDALAAIARRMREQRNVWCRQSIDEQQHLNRVSIERDEARAMYEEVIETGEPINPPPWRKP